MNVHHAKAGEAGCNTLPPIGWSLPLPGPSMAPALRACPHGHQRPSRDRSEDRSRDRSEVIFLVAAGNSKAIPIDNLDMTAPRQVLPGSIYMVTRRCAQGQFLLSPSALVNQVFLYCLAYAAQFSGVQVVAFVCLSNHWHAIVTDVEGRLSDFMAQLNRLVGKCINTSLGRFESLLSSPRTHTARSSSRPRRTSGTSSSMFCRTRPKLGWCPH